MLDKGDVGRESTWAGAGILSPLMPWDYGDAVNALSERGRALWPELATNLKHDTGLNPEYWACGMLVLGKFDQDAAINWCHTHRWDYSTVIPVAVARQSATEHGLWLPQVAQARNPSVSKALEAACRKAGVNFLCQTEVAGFDISSGRVTAVRTLTGRFQADSYVMCGGAWSQNLLRDTTLSLEIIPVRGQILLFKSEPGLLGHILYRDGQYLVPRMDGHILVGSTLEYVDFDKSITDKARNSLLHFALESMPDLTKAKLVKQWAGLRPGSPGNVPTISQHPYLENLYINSGHFRYGLTMAPASAELLVQLMLDRSCHLNTQPYGWNHS